MIVLKRVPVPGHELSCFNPVVVVQFLMAEQMEPVPSTPPVQNGNELNTDGIASLLAVARQRINEGNPSLALQAVRSLFLLQVFTQR